MSLDLFSALHGAVDGAHDDEPLDVDLASLGRRIRRRRHVRAGVRAGVGVAAAGAVALTVPQLTGVSSATRPAGLPLPLRDARPGTCGSSVSQLEQPREPGAGLLAATDAPALTIPAAGASLGTYVGDRLAVTLVEKQTSAVRAQQLAVAREQAQTQLASAQDQLAQAEAQQADLASLSSQAGRTADEQVHDHEMKQSVDTLVATIRAEIASTQSQLEAMGSGGQLTGLWLGVSQDARVLVTRAGTVVATDLAQPTANGGLDSLNTRTGIAAAHVEQTLATCSEPGRPGGDPLPAGTYEVYVGYAKDDEGALSRVAGPWTITIERPAAPELPAGVPQDLPLLPGKVLGVSAADGGWVVDIAADATDRLDAARALLQTVRVSTTPQIVASDGNGTSYDASDGSSLNIGNTAEVRLSDGSTWTITISDELRGDQSALRYRITPRSR